jgi:hypothetical protein
VGNFSTDSFPTERWASLDGLDNLPDAIASIDAAIRNLLGVSTNQLSQAMDIADTGAVRLLESLQIGDTTEPIISDIVNAIPDTPGASEQKELATVYAIRRFSGLGSGGGASSADEVTVDTSNFDGVLSAADDNVQLALDTIDDHTHGSHGHDADYVEIIGDTMTGQLNMDAASIYISGGGNLSVYAGDPPSGYNIHPYNGITGASATGNATLAWTDLFFTYDGYDVWHEGNDGTGSTLDADLLDGLHAVAFLLTDGTRELGADWGLGDTYGISEVPYIDFTLAGGFGNGEGRLTWNAEDGTLDLGMPGGTVNLQIGQEHLLRVRNQSGSSIPNGSIVYQTGASGNRPLVDLADASSQATARVLGVATEQIANNDNGYITLQGLVRGLNTDGIAAGTPLWLSDSVAGTWTTTRPTAPNISVAVGVVINPHISSGVIYVGPVHLQNLAYLSDVLFASPSDGDYLAWVAANSRFEYDNIDAERSFFNGSFVESFDALVTSNGTVITMSLEKSGTGDLTMRFSDGDTVLDCTDPVQTIALTVGTDTVPQANYIYIPQSTKVLTKSTATWPVTEHIKVGYFLVQSATKVQADGALINQNWNDHRTGTDNQGHMTHMAETIRLTMGGASWHSGVDGATSGNYVSIVTNVGTPDNVYFTTTAGVSYQMHRHTIPAVDTSGTDDIHVVNWNGTPYNEIQDIADIVADSLGVSLTNRYYNLVFWGVANKSGEYSPVMCNLPTGSYSVLSAALNDSSGYDVTSIPREFVHESTTAFLICRLTFTQSAASGGTWTLEGTKDLRGIPAGASAGGGAGGGGIITDHGTLTGLADDDHTQYLLADGSRDVTGDMFMDEASLQFTETYGIDLNADFFWNLFHAGDDYVELSNAGVVGGIRLDPGNAERVIIGPSGGASHLAMRNTGEVQGYETGGTRRGMLAMDSSDRTAVNPDAANNLRMYGPAGTTYMQIDGGGFKLIGAIPLILDNNSGGLKIEDALGTARGVVLVNASDIQTFGNTSLGQTRFQSGSEFRFFTYPITVDNAVDIQSRNAAGTGTKNLIKLDASDQVWLNSGGSALTIVDGAALRLSACPLRLENERGVEGLNNAGTIWKEILKVDASDQTIVGDTSGATVLDSGGIVYVNGAGRTLYLNDAGSHIDIKDSGGTQRQVVGMGTDTVEFGNAVNETEILADAGVAFNIADSGNSCRFLGFISAAGPPTTTEFPNNGDFGFFRNTSGGTTSFVYNRSGAIENVTIS